MSIFSIPIVNHTSLRGFSILLTFLSSPPSLAALFRASVHVLPYCTFPSLGHAASFLPFFLGHPHHFISSYLFPLRTPCPLFSFIYDPFLLYHSHSRYITITSSIYHPNSIKYASSGISFPQCFHALCHRIYSRLLLHTSSLCYALCGLATCAIFFSFLLCLFTSMFGHSHLKCPTLQHLKHLTSSWHLTSTSPFTPYCITLFTKTSNLFWGIDLPFPSFPLFLQLQARCSNCHDLAKCLSHLLFSFLFFSFFFLT